MMSRTRCLEEIPSHGGNLQGRQSIDNLSRSTHP